MEKIRVLSSTGSRVATPALKRPLLKLRPTHAPIPIPSPPPALVVVDPIPGIVTVVFVSEAKLKPISPPITKDPKLNAGSTRALRIKGVLIFVVAPTGAFSV
jgi:hypothetical protein